ncbi:hypothetical protein SmJEL517_g04464 [Synchytrium microbalum]|uniref:Protein phosphatase 1 regulatory subunit 7 n=1 Tax=Synchytrium microbalum TaxID=1806994 RepID=A0A507BTX0_9FUNG|nr:uncharacterized protein SmJEL517_g04464 [Synchytrium microbalum]TPX32417.1 hypothetical protein SmJEL517_g04464 [Synchytrium microbalum]
MRETVVSKPPHGASAISTTHSNVELKKHTRTPEWIFRNDQDVSLLSSNNGISESDFVHRVPSIQSLEMAHFNFSHIRGLEHFWNLTSLCLMTQDIEEINGLDSLSNLQSLWICETPVSRISGLDRCVKLERLFLYENQIKKIEGLDSLVKLQTLWLSDNKITTIENLDSLVNLKELQLSGNLIRHIGHSLDGNVNLQQLNLAGNRLQSFPEILNLVHLPSLTSLALADPNYAENPVCTLCNYQTNILYHFPNILRLDSHRITAEARKAVAATVLKKRMFYNMCAQTIRRNTAILHAATEDVYAPTIRAKESILQRQLYRKKCLLRHLDDLKWDNVVLSRPGTSSPLHIVLTAGCRQLESLIQKASKQIQEAKEARQRCLDFVSFQADHLVKRSQIELEMGGNVRFEDVSGCADDVERASGLIKKFLAIGRGSESAPLHINRFIKVHNRAVQARHKAKMSGKLNTAEPMHLCLEITDSQVFDLAEEGLSFKSKSDLMTDPITNFLQPTLNSNNGIRYCCLIQTTVENMVWTSPSHVQSLLQKHQESSSNVSCYYYDVPNVAKPPASSSLPPQRGFVFTDLDLVLPVYLVEFSTGSGLHVNEYEALEGHIRAIASSSKLALSEPPSLRRIQSPPDLMMDDVKIESHPEVDVAERSVVNTPMRMDNDTLRRLPTSATHLNIATSSIPPRFGDSISHLIHLRSLSISHCAIARIPADLTLLPSLESLDISFNILSSLNGIRALSKLTRLDACANKFASIESVVELKDCETLMDLDVRFNPVCNLPGLESWLISGISALQCLNNRVVDAEERIIRSNPVALLSTHASPQACLFRPLSIRTISGPGASSRLQAQTTNTLSNSKLNSSATLRIDTITILELDHVNLVDLSLLPTGLQANLRWLSLRKNGLTNIAKLASFTALEEVCVHGNAIQSIDCLAALPRLSRLEAGCNQIASLDASGWKTVSFMGLECNRLKDFKTVATMSSLLELYVANNDVEDLHNVFPLKELPRLIVLDLAGNAAALQSGYRLFSIFHLPRLKILDGSTITPVEASAAREAHQGRLTCELLAERVGRNVPFKSLAELDLPNCRLKDVECFLRSPANEFRSLRRLNLEGNYLVNADALRSLPSLRVLNLAQNRIDRLFSTDPPGALVDDTWMSASSSDAQWGSNVWPALEELHLSNNIVNAISDLGLRRIVGLRILTLQCNRITKIDGLERLPNLVELNMESNQIRHVINDAFIGCSSLKYLNVKENRLRTLQNFENLPFLKVLNVGCNRIQDTLDFDKLQAPSLREVILQGNPVLRRPSHRLALIARLPFVEIIDKREVIEEERRRAEVFGLEQTAPANIPALPQASTSLSILPKFPSRPTIVVLDGSEMKVNGSSNFGFSLGRAPLVVTASTKSCEEVILQDKFVHPRPSHRPTLIDRLPLSRLSTSVKGLKKNNEE